MRILFLIHDLGQGGAEKVLISLVNNMDYLQFDITVISLFGGGINEKYLSDKIHYKTIFPQEFPGNSKLMKILTPQQLHRLCVREKYDVEISYLEGPAARVISGCEDSKTKLVSWIHVEQHDIKTLSRAFRTEKEAIRCYNRFDQTICVSKFVKNDFCKILDFKGACEVLYNTVESDYIRKRACEKTKELKKDEEKMLIAVGTLKESKGYERLLRIVKRLRDEKYNVKLYILGIGPLENKIRKYIKDNNIENTISLLGYQSNPYKFVAKSDLFVCASFAEGFSTAATEALILGVPVCTVDVSGMKEMLGENNEFGIVTENSEEALYEGIVALLDNSEKLDYYKKQASIRGKQFETKSTVKKVEKMLEKLVQA